jgi:uncharacterized lipoprotein YehR (DUF1307 family)
MKFLHLLIVACFCSLGLVACGEKDEEKASQNRPAIPGY